MNTLRQNTINFLFFSMVLGFLFVNLSHAAEPPQRGLYLGIFGGGSASESTDMTQSGVAFYEPPLNVNVQGTSQSKTGAIGGSHLGYEWSEIPMGSASGWGLRPAVEIEGYYLGTSQSGGLANSQAEPAAGERALVPIGAHTFTDSSNLNMGVLLANSIFTFKTPWFKKIFPYVGGGIGGAITSISNANSAQTGTNSVGPAAEPGINHFNSNPNASSSSFATQGKIGIRAELLDHLSLFAEYRYLYIAATNYTFGSTVYSSHVPTTNWNTHYGSMGFNTGIFGIEYGF
jgi:opacity protein-like surface antigen